MSIDTIRKGDLVKATLKSTPGESSVFRVAANEYNGLESTGGYYFGQSYFDFEVLERPIEEELLKGAVEAYRTARFPDSTVAWGILGPATQKAYREHITAVIEFVRQYDAKKAER